jgi:phenylacetate-CoA ligase
VKAALADVQQSEFITPEKMKALQAPRQIAQLRFVMQRVPYYQKSFAAYRHLIDKTSTWDDISQLMNQLPILEKDEIILHKDAFFADNLRWLKTYPSKTSGSSGTPLIFPCDQLSWAYRHALTFRCMAAFGVNIGEPYAYIFGLHWHKMGQLKVRLRDWVFNRVRLSAYNISPATVDTYLTLLRKKQPTHFVGYPSAIYDFCLLLAERGKDLHDLPLKAIFTTAEPLRAYQRAAIEAVTGSRCVNIYGSAEAGVGAYECPAGSLHVTSEVIWLQSSHPSSVPGSAIVTDMMSRAFPFIRYAIGDEIIFQEGLCDCGRPHPRLLSIEGRIGEPVILPNGRRINANLPSYIFKALSSLNAIRRYRFVHTCSNSLELYLVVTQNFKDEYIDLIKQETLAAFGQDIFLTVHVVESLPHLPNAKHRDYVCLC